MKQTLVLVFSLMFLIVLSDNSYSQKTINDEIDNVNASEFDSLYRIGFSKFRMPIHKNGILADVIVSSKKGGEYDNKAILCCGGFFISGKNHDTLWVAGNASSAGILDFLSGSIGESPSNPANKFYFVRKTDAQFGTSWQNWQEAVNRGASFYDGNNDGIYNPVDLNGNNTWDINEDKPDLAGDLTIHTKYDDGAALGSWFEGMRPMGIEINQTIYSFKNSTEFPNASDIFFIKYSINNTGIVAASFDSVLFSPWMDADLGDLNDDLAGTDTLNNGVYMYNEGDDASFGLSVPSIGIIVLKSPEEGEIPLRLNSTAHSRFSHQVIGDPYSAIELRYFQEGLTRAGEKINPCTWTLGTVRGGVDCNLINRKFFYSGDPVSNSGWINNSPADYRVMSTVKPFTLNRGVRSEIIISYVAARGDSAIKSVELMRSNFIQAKGLYEQKFPTVVVGVNEEELQPVEFVLEQNYPNPFNPETKIRFQLNKTEVVKLSVFNVLGQEIKTLVNEELSSGVHEVTFNGNDLASGLYFYQLKTSENSAIKKMVLIK